MHSLKIAPLVSLLVASCLIFAEYTVAQGPKSINAQAINSSSIEVTWDLPDVEYIVTVYENGVNVLEESFSDKHATLTGLKACTQYRITVAAKWSDTNQMLTSEEVIVDMPSPSVIDPISDLKLNWATTRNLTAKLTDQDRLCPTSYQITFMDQNGKVLSDGVEKISSKMFTGLIPGKGYQVTVVVIDDNTKRVSTEVNSGIVFTNQVSAPQNLRGENITSIAVDLAWAPGATPAEITGYMVSIVNAKSYEFIARNVLVEKPSYSVTGLEPCTDYKVVVGSIYQDVPLPRFSEAITITTASPSVTDTLSQADLKKPTYTTLTVEIIDIDRNCPVKYHYEIYTAAGEQIDSKESEGTSLVFTGLQPGTAYQAKASAINSDTGVESVRITSNVESTLPAPPPTNLQGENLAAKSAKLVWQAPTPSDELNLLGYQVKVINKNDNSTVFDQKTTDAFVQVTSLTPCKDYSAVVAAIYKEVDGLVYAEQGYTFSTSSPATTVPVKTITLTNESYKTMQVIIVDQPRCCNTQYRVEVVDTDGKYDPISFETDEKMYTVTNLQPGTTYTASVISVDSQTNNTSEAVVSSKHSTWQAPPVENLGVAKNDKNSVEIGWSPPTLQNKELEISNYFVIVMKDGKPAYKKIIPPTQTSVTVEGLSACTNYATFVAVIYTDVDQKPFADELNFKTTSPAVVDPVDYAQLITSTSLSVTLSITDTNRLCNVYYSIDMLDTKGNIVTSTTSNDTDIKITGLQPNTEYSAKVVAVDEGSGRQSNAVESNVFLTVPAPEPKKVNVEDSSITENSGVVTWEAPEETFELELSGFVVSLNNSTDTYKVDKSQTSFEIPNLTACNDYSVTVGATYLNVNDPVYSESFSFKTSTPSIVKPVNSVSVDQITASSITATVDDEARDCATTYEYTLYLNDKASKTINAAVKTYKFDRLRPSTQYTVGVKAQNRDNTNESEEVKSDQVTTLSAPVPTNLKVSSIDQNTAGFSWAPPAKAAGLELVSYSVVVSIKQTVISRKDKLNKASTSDTATALMPCTTYMVKVGAAYRDVPDVIFGSPVEFTTDSPKVINPIGSIGVSAATTDGFTWTIKDVARECNTKYQLTVFDDIKTPVLSFESDSLNGNLNGLKPQNQYTVSVMAQDERSGRVSRAITSANVYTKSTEKNCADYSDTCSSTIACCTGLQCVRNSANSNGVCDRCIPGNKYCTSGASCCSGRCSKANKCVVE